MRYLFAEIKMYSREGGCQPGYQT